jgi:hypothetical protein
MAAYAGVKCLYKTEAGFVPATTVAHRTGATAAASVIADVAFGSATFLDIVTEGYQPTRITAAPIGAGTNFAARLTNAVGSVWIPA